MYTGSNQDDTFDHMFDADPTAEFFYNDHDGNEYAANHVSPSNLATLHSTLTGWNEDLLDFDNTFITPSDSPLPESLSWQDTDPLSLRETEPQTVDATWLNQHAPSPILPLGAGVSTPPSATARALPRRRSKYSIRRSQSGSRPIAIPQPISSHGRDQPLAMQRWRDSPPEDEPASFSAIVQSISQAPAQASDESTSGNHLNSSRSSSCPRRPSSRTSLDSDVSSTSLQSGQSGASGRSGHSNRSGPLPRSKLKVSRSKKTGSTQTPRPFQCTFCCDTFRTKYDWTRHEKSLHLVIADWQCAPSDGVARFENGQTRCIYCHGLDTTTEHLSSHAHYTCRPTPTDPPTFKRRDHLSQHLRLVHHIEGELPCIDDWRVPLPPITSRCGFCSVTLTSWEERSEHLSAHFRQGKTMSDWQGDHDFEPIVANRIVNALPPYLIASESRSLVPYSATSRESRDHMSQIYSQIDHLSENTMARTEPIRPLQMDKTESVVDPTALGRDIPVMTNSTTTHSESFAFADRLALHLSRFARQQLAQGVMPSDAMFQQEARRAMYDDDDDWNQTIADNATWLERFRLKGGWQPNGT